MFKLIRLQQIEVGPHVPWIHDVTAVAIPVLQSGVRRLQEVGTKENTLFVPMSGFELMSES